MKKRKLLCAWEIEEEKIILIGIPHYGTQTMSWGMSFRDLQYPEEYKVIHSTVRDLPIDVERNILAEKALALGADYLLFLDSDISPPTDTLIKLLDMEVDIASGVYYTKSEPVEPCMYMGSYKDPIPIHNYRIGDVLQVDLIGLGCCLIHRRVFEEVDRPFFSYTYDPIKKEGSQEDFDFCKKSKEKGFKIYVDTTIQCKRMVMMYIDYLGMHYLQI